MVVHRVWLEKEQPSRLLVTGTIVDSLLQLLRYETDAPLKCVNFDRTYFGTDVVRSGILYNNSPESMRFVMVLNDTAEGQLQVRRIHSGPYLGWGGVGVVLAVETPQK